MKIEPRSVERQLGRVDRQQRNGPSVKTLFPRTLAGALLSGAVTVVGMGLAPGIAHADGGPYTWCPGQSMEDPSGPNRYGNQYVWDMNVCHTWYRVTYGYGNVPRFVAGQQTLQGSSAWDGEDPPVPEPVNCGLFWCPIPPHPDPNFHG